MGQSEAWAGLELETIGPVRIHDHAEHETVNNHSVVLRLTHDQVRILLPGDAEAEAEQDLLAHPEVLQAEIIKVPHHGSDSSSTPALLAAVRPRDAIASAGIGNRYGHPAAEVASRYQAAGATFWRTDQQGAVCVCSQGTGYRITAHHSRP
jgi:competence protein ComEC